MASFVLEVYAVDQLPLLLASLILPKPTGIILLSHIRRRAVLLSFWDQTLSLFLGVYLSWIS